MRLALLLFSFSPMLCWAIAIFGLFFCRHSALLSVGSVSLLAIGYLLAKATPSIQKRMYAGIRNRIGNIADDDWVPAELERLGTEDKVHVVPDELGVVFKEGNRIHIATARGVVCSFLAGDALILAKPRRLSLSLSFVDKSSRTPLSQYSLSPKYTGEDLDVSGYAEKRLKWFSDWTRIGWEEVGKQ